jgi:hypothetical protein
MDALGSTAGAVITDVGHTDRHKSHCRHGYQTGEDADENEETASLHGRERDVRRQPQSPPQAGLTARALRANEEPERHSFASVSFWKKQ